MIPGFIVELFILIATIHHVSSDIEVRNSDGRYVKSFTSDVVHGRPFDDDINGLVILADPPEACEPIKKVDFCCNVTRFSKFVLVSGSTTSNCSAKKKVENAINADFDLAILYGEKIMGSPGDNTKQGFSSFKFFYDDDDDLKYVKISNDDGQFIQKNYLYRNSSEKFYYLTVVFKNQMHYYLMLFAVVIAVCFVVIIFFMICLLAKYIQERQHSRRNRLSSRQIKQLPTEKYSKDSGYDVCAICLENYAEGEKLRILPCSHVYHTRCVDPWLMENRRNCPLCKRKVHMGDTSSDSDSDSSSATESTPLVTPTSAGNTWGTFGGPSTSGEHLNRGAPVVSALDIDAAICDDSDSSGSDNIIVLPSTAGSVNAAYEEDLNDIRPKSV